MQKPLCFIASLCTHWQAFSWEARAVPVEQPLQLKACMSRERLLCELNPRQNARAGAQLQILMVTLPCHAVAFLEGVIKDLIEAKLPRSEQPLLFLRMHVARYLLVLGQTKECKAAVEEGKQSLDSMGDVSAAMPSERKV